MTPAHLPHSDIREWVERDGNGLPDVAEGLVFSVNGQLVVIDKVLGRFVDPLMVRVRVRVEVEVAR